MKPFLTTIFLLSIIVIAPKKPARADIIQDGFARSGALNREIMIHECSIAAARADYEDLIMRTAALSDIAKADPLYVVLLDLLASTNTSLAIVEDMTIKARKNQRDASGLLLQAGWIYYTLPVIQWVNQGQATYDAAIGLLVLGEAQADAAEYYLHNNLIGAVPTIDLLNSIGGIMSTLEAMGTIGLGMTTP